MDPEKAREEWRAKAREAMKSLGLGTADDEAYWFARHMGVGYAQFDRLSVGQYRRLIALVEVKRPGVPA